MLKKARNFLNSPNGKRLAAWALPIIIAYVQRKALERLRRGSGNDRKRIKNKAK